MDDVLNNDRRGRGRPRIHAFPLVCGECGYSTDIAGNYHRHVRRCQDRTSGEQGETSTLTIVTGETTEIWLRRQLEQKDGLLREKDRVIAEKDRELLRQLRQKDRQLELMSKRPRSITNTVVTNNTVQVDVRPFTKERFEHIPREKIEQLLRDPPNAVAGLMRLTYQDPKNVNMRCPNKRENRYEVLKMVERNLRWVALTKDEALDDAHITFATKLESYADENDNGVGSRFCRWMDKVKDSQDGLDGGKLYAEQKAKMHMGMTTRN